VSSAPADILVLVGTKAQFIKTAPILREMDSRGTSYRLIYTGQHSETFEDLERAFGTRPPDDNLVPATEADSALGLVGWSLKFMAAAWRRIRRGEWRGARWGVVHGDTASTLLTALALRAAGVPVAHVEAGLRSPRLLSPFPEEIIRRLVSRVATLHLSPDPVATANLRNVRGRVVDTGGNTLRDALVMALSRLASLGIRPGEGGYALVSIHRSENLSSRRVFDLLMNSVVDAAKILPVRFVLHPVTRRQLVRTGWRAKLECETNIALLERTDYPGFVQLMLGARLLLTDGGSNQEEAAMLGLPTLLLRDATERADGIAEGVVVLSRLDPALIQAYVRTRAAMAWTASDVSEIDSPSSRIMDSLTCAS
jgi:UDP-N-acetylglucosamine 2-epimerase (non-hydrolysing)